MKTSLGVDCVAIDLDYDAVKEAVQILSGCPSNYERTRLRPSERDENFALSVPDLLLPWRYKFLLEKCKNPISAGARFGVSVTLSVIFNPPTNLWKLV